MNATTATWSFNNVLVSLVQEELKRFVFRADNAVPNDVRWKFWFELGKVAAKTKVRDLQEIHRYLRKAAEVCPGAANNSQAWKVWLGSARIALNLFKVDQARRLLERAEMYAPRKSKHAVLLERSRMEEYEGNVERARSIIARGKSEFPSEWKLYLESILLEYRAGNVSNALKQAEEAVVAHPGTGRLWAIFIALSQFKGVDEQEAVFLRAQEEVQKSGEIWCEGARLRMNPLSPHFDLLAARRYLEKAIQFTPQYGDSFIEYLRLELLWNGPSRNVQELMQYCMHIDPNYGTLWSVCKDDENSSAYEVLMEACSRIQRDLYEARSLYARALLRGNAKYRRPRYAGILGHPIQSFRYLPASICRMACILCKKALIESVMPHGSDVSAADYPDNIVVLGCQHIFHKLCHEEFRSPAPISWVLGESGNDSDRLCPLCSEPSEVVKEFRYSTHSRLSASLASSAQSSARPSEHLSEAPTAGHRRSYAQLQAPSTSATEISSMFESVGSSLADLFSSAPSRSDRQRGRSYGRLVDRKVKAAPADTDPQFGFIVGSSDFAPHSFVTGMIQVNRDMLHIRETPFSTREKIIFGSDSVAI